MPTNAEKIRDGFNYYKAVFGFRPSLMTRTDKWEDEAIAVYDAAEAEMQKRQSTKAGRNKLRDEGWQLKDDPNSDYRE